MPHRKFSEIRAGIDNDPARAERVRQITDSMMKTQEAEPLEGPPFGDEEYAELARRYRETGGRAPSADERAADQSALIS